MGWGEGRRGNEGLWIGELGESGALVDHAYAFEKKKVSNLIRFFPCTHSLTTPNFRLGHHFLTIAMSIEANLSLIYDHRQIQMDRLPLYH